VVVTAYSLAFGSLLLLGGRLSDLFGQRRMLIIGLTGFAAASALGGAATGFDMLVIGRAIQGAFGALLAPAALSTLAVTFSDPAERGKAFGVYGAIAGAGGAVGLLLGGVLTEYLSWRWCLYVNVVLALVAVTGAVRLLVNQPRSTKVHLDPAGTVLVVAGLVGVVYGLSEAETKGWGAPATIALLVAGVVLLAAFVLVERRVPHPLLPLRIVLDRFRGGSYLAIGLSAIGLFGVFLFLTYYLQLILRYSPVATGLAFLPMIAALIATSTTVSAVLLPRFGPRTLIPAGMLVAAARLVILAAQLGVSTSYPSTILPALVVIGLGLGGEDHAGPSAARVFHALDAGRPHPVTSLRPSPGRRPAMQRRGRDPRPASRRRGRDPRPGRGGGTRQGPRLPRPAGRAAGPPDHPGRHGRGHQPGAGQRSHAGGRQSARRLRSAPVPRRPGRRIVVPHGDRLHRNPPRHGHRADSHRRPEPSRRIDIRIGCTDMITCISLTPPSSWCPEMSPSRSQQTTSAASRNLRT
jgi:MFS family permease